MNNPSANIKGKAAQKKLNVSVELCERKKSCISKYPASKEGEENSQHVLKRPSEEP